MPTTKAVVSARSGTTLVSEFVDVARLAGVVPELLAASR
jgi:hypothetical protein